MHAGEDLPTAVVTLLDALGRVEAHAATEAFCARGAPALRALLHALVHPTPGGGGSNDVNRRAWMEDLETCLVLLARAHPDTLLVALDEEPALADRFDVLSALHRLDDARATDWLLRALSHRRGTIRWVALHGLLECDDASVTPRLRTLLRDRDGLVALEAIDGLRRWGVPDDVPALVAFAPRASVGASEAAWDAIETICVRHDAPLPAEHPGSRLTIVEGPHERADVRVQVPQLVRRGDTLAATNDLTTTAPFDGVVSWIDHIPDGVRIALRAMAPPG